MHGILSGLVLFTELGGAQADPHDPLGAQRADRAVQPTAGRHLCRCFASLIAAAIAAIAAIAAAAAAVAAAVAIAVEGEGEIEIEGEIELLSEQLRQVLAQARGAPLRLLTAHGGKYEEGQ
jgi:hypothetical protein